MTIVKRPCDVDLLAAIHAQCFAQAWSAASIASLMDTPGTFACVCKSVGFALLRVADDEAELLTLAVIPAARRRGVASALLIEGARHACDSGAKTLFLEVGATNTAAKTLYAKHSFLERGRRHGYYAKPDGSHEDALVFGVQLPLRRVGKALQLD